MYSRMSVKMLKEVCQRRGFSEHSGCSGGVLRRPAGRGRGGTVAQTLRSRLQRQDKAWDEKVPEDGVEVLLILRAHFAHSLIQLRSSSLRSSAELQCTFAHFTFLGCCSELLIHSAHVI